MVYIQMKNNKYIVKETLECQQGPKKQGHQMFDSDFRRIQIINCGKNF